MSSRADEQALAALGSIVEPIHRTVERRLRASRLADHAIDGGGTFTALLGTDCSVVVDFGVCYDGAMSGKDLADREARAARRRSTWQGGVAKLAGMEDVDDHFWGAMPPAERFVFVWEASREQYGIDTETPGGLRGSVGGIRRR